MRAPRYRLPPPVRTTQYCQAPGCKAQACYGFGPPMPDLRTPGAAAAWLVAHRWFCPDHRAAGRAAWRAMRGMTPVPEPASAQGFLAGAAP